MNEKWYIAELVEEFRSADSDTSLIHINSTLVRSVDPENAYLKALRFGENLNREYRNTEGVLVRVRFRGLHELIEIYEDLEDGAEIMFVEKEEISEQDIEQLIKRKSQLLVFGKA